MLLFRRELFHVYSQAIKANWLTKARKQLRETLTDFKGGKKSYNVDLIWRGKNEWPRLTLTWCLLAVINFKHAWLIDYLQSERSVCWFKFVYLNVISTEILI